MRTDCRRVNSGQFGPSWSLRENQTLAPAWRTVLTIKAMRQLIGGLLLFCLIASGYAQTVEKENAVKGYYSGFENHDWTAVRSQFADDFTFTSPNNDDHIPIEKFKEKCWPTNKFFKKVNYIKMAESGDDLFLLVEIVTTDNKVVRNVDVFSFNSTGKIKSIEVFFGAGSKYPGNPK